MTYKILKLTFLYFSKWMGLFYVSRYITRQGLRILCYHGFSLTDESRFRPQLFIDPATFRNRLRFLSRKEFSVLKLDQALDRLVQGNLPRCATVITIDDGFFSVYQCGLKLLKEFNFPVTVYVNTYWCMNGNPVFRLLVQYMFWKTERRQIDLTGLGVPQSGPISLQDKGEKDQVMWNIINFGQTQCEDAQRCAIAGALGERLGVDDDMIAKSRIFGLINPREIREMVHSGIDIQLHTHSHSFPEDEILATQEIAANRAMLEPLVGKTLQHFCYPRGFWSEKQWSWLAAAGIKSAATCEPGLNDTETPPLALKRFLDGEHISQVEFEAEVSGYIELFRLARSRMERGVFSAHHRFPRRGPGEVQELRWPIPEPRGESPDHLLAGGEPNHPSE